MQAIAQEQTVAFLINATCEVFEKMVVRHLTQGTPIEGNAMGPRANVVATVSFAGAESGIVAFYSTKVAACEIAGALMGMDPAEMNGDMPDAIGEVANMIAGSLRTKMKDAGTPCGISIPTVTVGSDFYTKYVSDVRRILCPFKMGEHEIFVELVLQKQ
jgi:chemotaxis protein CheX